MLACSQRAARGLASPGTRPPDYPSLPRLRPPPPHPQLASFRRSIWDAFPFLRSSHRTDKPRFSTSGSPLPRHSPPPPPPPKVRRARSAEPRACTAQVLCQPVCRLRAVYGLESHMALGLAGASTLQLSSEHDEVPKSTHLHEEQHVFLCSAQSFSPTRLQLAYRPEPQSLG